MQPGYIDPRILRGYTLYVEWLLSRAIRYEENQRVKAKTPPGLHVLSPANFVSLRIAADTTAALVKLTKGMVKDNLTHVPPQIMSLLRNVYSAVNEMSITVPSGLLRGIIDFLLNDLDLSRFNAKAIAEKSRDILAKFPNCDGLGFCIITATEILSRLNYFLSFTVLSPQPENSFLVRQIEFPPEYYQSGMSILGYFGTVIRKKYSDKHIKVRIEQADLNVKMIVETSEGLREEIERTLEKYGMVVLGQMSPEELFPDKADALELKHQLRLAMVQLETQREMLALKSDLLRRTDERVDFLESQYKQLTEIVGTSLKMADAATSQLAALAEQAVKSNNASLAEALTLLRKTIEAGVIPKDETSVKNALTTIQQEPGVFRQVCDLLVKGSVSGAAGNALYAFIINLVSMLPK